jgi:hypothetical protein
MKGEKEENGVRCGLMCTPMWCPSRSSESNIILGMPVAQYYNRLPYPVLFVNDRICTCLLS